jgi:AcrR family transcriptional regulator
LSFDPGEALEKAMLAFWRHGYETTSINDLTAVMGVTAPSLYAAFGDKKQLFLQAMRLYAGAPEALQQALDAAPTAYDAARDMLLGSARAFTGEATPRGCLLASATASVSKSSADVQKAVSEVRLDILARLEARIARDVTLGLLPHGTSASSLATMVIAVIQGMSVLARDGLGRAALEHMIEGAMKAWPATASRLAH